MTLIESSRASGSVSRAPRPSSLADVLDLILDKGLVIDAYVRVSVAGIELLTIDARVVVASVDTYLRFAEAVNRLDLSQTEERGIDALTGKSRGNSDGDDDQSDEDGSGKEQRSQRSSSNGSRDRQPSLSRSSKGHDEENKGQDEDESGEDDDSPGLLERLTDRARFDR